MNKFFKAFAFVVAVFCLTWVGVLWWWDKTARDVQSADMVFFLLVWPLLLLVGLLALRWGWRFVAARQLLAASAPAGSAASQAATTGNADAVTQESLAKHAVLHLVNAATLSVTGDQIDSLLDAALSGKPLPEPDGQLLNDEGMPVLCARIPDKTLPLDNVRAELEALMPSVKQRQAEWQSLALEIAFVRALAALQEPLLAQRSWLLALDAMIKGEQGDDEIAALANLPPAQRPPLPTVRVLLGWPAHWSLFEQAMARAWAEGLLSDPAVKMTEAFDLSYTAVLGAGEELWVRADQFSQSAVPPHWLLIAACHSDIDQARVDALSGMQQLFDASARPSARMVGEAAVSVLLAKADWVAPQELDCTPIKLHRPALLRRDKPIESSGKIDHKDIAQAMAQALIAAQIEPDALSSMVCDGDQHSARLKEAFGLMSEALAHLDPVEDIRLLGKITGYTGAASWLLVLASAAAIVKTNKKCVLALGLADSTLRMALVLKPMEQADAAA